LHSGLTIGNGLPRRGQDFCRRVRGLGHFQLGAGVVQRGVGFGQRALGVGAGRSLLVDRLFGGGLCALACVERGVECQAVVTLDDRVMGTFEGVFGRGEFLAREPIGAGGARGIDRRLRLLDFLVGGIAARRCTRR
jgi:hypothetical protein